MNPKINIIFRSCDAVNAVHNVARPFGLDKKTLIKVCFKSLYDSLQGFNYKIIVLGDNLSEEMTNFFLGYKVELIEGIFGNDESIRQTIRIAEKFNEDEWVYFCEDDYFHKKEAFQYIVDLIENKEAIIPAKIQFKQLLRKRELTLLSFKRFFKQPNLVIHPCDYPDRYKLEYAAKNFIFHSNYCHWRQIADTTFTFLIQVKEVKKRKNVLMRSSQRANDRYLSKNLFGKSFFYSKLLCISPIPSLSTHMHVDTMSPLVDWEPLVNEVLKELN